MSSFTVLVALGFLGVSMGVPVNDSLRYDPQDFYPSGRIVGGTEAPDNYAPHMAALVVGDVVSSLMCGASVVSKDFMLTAAHCIDPLLSWEDGQLVSSARGLVGSNSLSGGYWAVRFSSHENHPAWDPRNIKNDIGLLRLADKLPLGPRVSPIPLRYKWVGGGERIGVTGWGRLSDDVSVIDPRSDHSMAWGSLPDKLQLLYVESLSPEECEEGVREANAQLGPSPPVQPDVELCTRHPRGAGQGVCNGDSGSALVDRLGRQVALVSWGWACARGLPDVHARLGGLRGWLQPALSEGD